MASRSKRRAAAVALALVSVTIPLVVSAPALAQDGTDVIDGCRVAVGDGGSRACSAAERLVWLGAQHCRRVPGADAAVCPAVDGRDTSEAAVAGFEQGWTARALELQSALDRDVPLTESLILHTHNSANSAAYAPSLTSSDANQVLSVTDQLRLGIRGIEFDAHWTPHPTGDPAQGFRAPVQCHGQSPSTPAGAIHVGCSVDQPLVELFGELRTWLDRPEAADQLVLLYLENQLEGSPAAHDATMAALESTLGDLVFRPEQGAGCQTLPFARSKGEILATGARVLVTGNCGPGGSAWNDVVFERGTPWNESGSTTTYLAGSDCDTERGQQSYGTSFVRRYEDSTGLSLAATGGSYISPAVAAAMVRCGVNMPGLDQLHPADGRLPAFVWSWREGDRADDPTRACAAQGDDTRFGSLPCERTLRVACRTIAGGWAVTTDAVPWAQGDAACIAAGHPSAGVPANGWDDVLLRRAAGDGTGDVWLAYGRDADGRWVADIPALPDDGGDGGDPKDDKPKKDKPAKDDEPKDHRPPKDDKAPKDDKDSTAGLGEPASSDRSLPVAAGLLALAVVATAVPVRRRRADRG